MYLLKKKKKPKGSKVKRILSGGWYQWEGEDLGKG
jgi:hypothetical protein